MFKIENINKKEISKILEMVFLGLLITIFVSVMGTAILFLIIAYIVGLFVLPYIFIPFTFIWIISTIIVYNECKKDKN